MNSWLNIPYDCVNFISYASYRNNLRKNVKFWPKIKIPLALDIKNWGFQLKRARGGSQDKKMPKNWTVDRWPRGRPIRRGSGFKEAPHASFFTYSPLYLEDSSHPCLQKSVWARSWTVCGLWSGFWDAFEARVSIWNLGFWVLGAFSLCIVCLKHGSISSQCT